MLELELLLIGDKLSSTIHKANVIDEPLGMRNSDRILESEVVLEKVEEHFVRLYNSVTKSVTDH
jgi:hypothetical protein